MKFVVFEDSKVFNKAKLWDIGDIKHKFPMSTVEYKPMAIVRVLSNDGKILQKGYMFEGDGGEVLEQYEQVKKI